MTQHEMKTIVSNLSPTATARWGTGGNNVPFLVDAGTARRLSPEEVELLQGFPVGWTAPAAVSTRYKQLGNAVTVNVIGWIAGKIDV